MKTIILAAGRGSRLGERTKDRPKCMCTLQGRTLLDRCMETLERAGVSPADIGIVTGYCYSDVVFSPGAFQALAGSSAPLAITYYTGYWDLWSRRMEDPLADLETFRLSEEGRLLEIGKKPRGRDEIQGQFMGLLRFTPESWAWVEETIRQPMAKTVEKLDMTTLLQELLQREYPVQAISTSDLWLECDSEQDILVYEREFSKELM